MYSREGVGYSCCDSCCWLANNSCSLLPKDAQIVLFSATFPSHVHQYASKFAPNANEITLQHEELTVEGIKQLYIDCSNDEDKYQTLVQLYGLLTVGSSIIFVKVSTAVAVCVIYLTALDPCFCGRN